MQEMALAWEEYGRLERSVEQLRAVLQAHMNHSATPQVRRGTAASEFHVQNLCFYRSVLILFSSFSGNLKSNNSLLGSSIRRHVHFK